MRFLPARAPLTRALVAALLLSFAAATPAEAQRRRASSAGQRPARRPRASAGRTNTRASAADVADARARLADQVKILSRFLYLYGRVSGTIEANDAAGAGGTDASRGALAANFRNIRAGLDDLSSRFDSTPALAAQAVPVGNAADLAARAESQLSAGNLDDAGRTLVTALANLTDALAGLR